MLISRRALIGAIPVLAAQNAMLSAATGEVKPHENNDSKEDSVGPVHVSILKLERFETTGTKALSEWERLKERGSGWPIIVGGEEQLTALVKAIDDHAREESFENILERAAHIRHPDDLNVIDEKARAAILEELKREILLPDDKLPMKYELDNNDDLQLLDPADARRRIQAEIDAGAVPVGEWPAEASIISGSFFAYDHVQGKPREKVYILIVPVADGAEALAYLRWAGFNSCPATAFHVAALRDWKIRFGAQLVGLGDDAIELRISHRPKTREVALELAREHLAYCSETGETLAPLAASLMGSDWWFFWWD